MPVWITEVERFPLPPGAPALTSRSDIFSDARTATLDTSTGRQKKQLEGLPDYFRIADLNEAARAADASREVEGRWLLVAEISFGSQGGPCDPSQKNDAGGTPAS